MVDSNVYSIDYQTGINRIVFDHRVDLQKVR